jgi:hypothetical protein
MKEPKDLLIKLYFYCNSGITIINDFRNLGLGVFALYFALKIEHPLMLVGMFIVSVPILFVMGYYNVHKISSVRERLSTKYGTHFTIRQFELIEEQVRLLKEINAKLTPVDKLPCIQCEDVV